MRFRLQRKEQSVAPNILGNKSFPVYSCRWKDIAASDDLSALEKYRAQFPAKGYRIIDTCTGKEAGSQT